MPTFYTTVDRLGLWQLNDAGLRFFHPLWNEWVASRCRTVEGLRDATEIEEISEADALKLSAELVAAGKALERTDREAVA